MNFISVSLLWINTSYFTGDGETSVEMVEYLQDISLHTAAAQ
jgi:hypothetical protein